VIERSLHKNYSIGLERVENRNAAAIIFFVLSSKHHHEQPKKQSIKSINQKIKKRLVIVEIAHDLAKTPTVLLGEKTISTAPYPHSS
jgi:uncharacterized protein YdhG (YjbR/CyaY superfamily)